MLIIHIDHGEAIDKALKRYKNKHRATRLMDQLRRRQYFVMPSISRRTEIKAAAYREVAKERLGIK